MAVVARCPASCSRRLPVRGAPAGTRGQRFTACAAARPTGRPASRTCTLALYRLKLRARRCPCSAGWFAGAVRHAGIHLETRARARCACSSACAWAKVAWAAAMVGLAASAYLGDEGVERGRLRCSHGPGSAAAALAGAWVSGWRGRGAGCWGRGGWWSGPAAQPLPARWQPGPGAGAWRGRKSAVVRALPAPSFTGFLVRHAIADVVDALESGNDFFRRV